MGIINTISNLFKSVGTNTYIKPNDKIKEQNNALLFQWSKLQDWDALSEKCVPLQKCLNAYLDMFSKTNYNLVPRKMNGRNKREQKSEQAKADEAANKIADILHYSQILSSNFDIRKILRNLSWYNIDGITIMVFDFEEIKDAETNTKITLVKHCAFRPLESLNIEYDDNGFIEKIIDQKTNKEIPLNRCLIMRKTHKDAPTNLNGIRKTVSYLANWYISLHDLWKDIQLNNLSSKVIIGVPTIHAGMDEETVKSLKDTIAEIMDFMENNKTMENIGAAIKVPSDLYLDNEGNPTTERMFTFTQIKGDPNDSTSVENTINAVWVQMAALFYCRNSIGGSMGVTGSYNLTEQQQEQEYADINAIVSTMFDEINRKLMPILCGANGIDLKYMPKLDPTELKVNQIDTIVKVLNTAAQLQVKVPKDTIAEAFTMVGLPLGQEEIEYFSDTNSIAKPEKIVEA